MPEKSSKSYTSVENQNFIILMTGVFLCLIGVLMLFANLQAGGDVNFKCLQISGKVASSSAGIFVLFFGVILIALTKVSSKVSKKATPLKRG